MVLIHTLSTHLVPEKRFQAPLLKQRKDPLKRTTQGQGGEKDIYRYFTSYPLTNSTMFCFIPSLSGGFLNIDEITNVTGPKFNIEPDHDSFQKRYLLFQRAVFRVSTLNFRVINSWNNFLLDVRECRSSFGSTWRIIPGLGYVVNKPW